MGGWGEACRFWAWRSFHIFIPLAHPVLQHLQHLQHTRACNMYDRTGRRWRCRRPSTWRRSRRRRRSSGRSWCGWRRRSATSSRGCVSTTHACTVLHRIASHRIASHRIASHRIGPMHVHVLLASAPAACNVARIIQQPHSHHSPRLYPPPPRPSLDDHHDYTTQDLLSYISDLSARQSAELTSGMTQDVVEAMKMLVSRVLASLRDHPIVEKESMELDSAALAQLIMWGLVTGYSLRELEKAWAYGRPVASPSLLQPPSPPPAPQNRPPRGRGRGGGGPPPPPRGSGGGNKRGPRGSGGGGGGEGGGGGGRGGGEGGGRGGWGRRGGGGGR
jgi:hypothetical protein